MKLSKKLGLRSSDGKPRKPKRSASSRLGLQRLESRQLMAADFGLSDGTLSINGSSQDDSAEVYVEGDQVSLTVTSYDASGEIVSEESAQYSTDEVDRVIFQGGDGNDLFVNDSSIESIVRGGAGDDAILGGTADDILVGGTGDDVILGGGGNDRILAGPGQNIVASTSESLPESGSESDTDDTEPVESPESESKSEPEIAATENAMDVDSNCELESETDQQAAETTEPIVAVQQASVTPVESATEDSDELNDEPTDPPPVELTNASIDVLGDSMSEDTGTMEESETMETETEVELIASVDTVDSDDTAVVEDETSIDLMSQETGEDLSNCVPVEPVAASDSQESDDDIIFGGSGDDWIMGDSGDDTIFGGTSPLDDELLRTVISGRLRLAI